MSLPFEITNRNFLLQIKKMHQQIMVGDNGRPVRSVLFTSVASGHGVSTVTANLAYVLSNAGDAKVLLVDGNNAGITNDEDINTVLQNPLADNLFAIKASWGENGGCGINVIERFNDLLEQFSYILLDVPPVVQVPEVLGLVPLLDLVLLVLQSNTTKWQAVSKVQETIEDALPKNLKVVLNRKQHYIPSRLYRWM